MNTPHIKKKIQFPTDLILHLHPRIVPLETIRFTLSFGLGGMATTLVLLLFFTGILQKLSYTPEIENAYSSIQYMYTSGNFAGWLRNIHYWSGNLLVIVTLLHCCRVLLTGGIGKSRRVNWIVGLLLFCLVCFSNFSGYLLPWDQLAFWAVTIFLNMVGYIPLVGETCAQLLRGGSDIGAGTLSNFYAIHTGLMPFLLILLTICHFWLVRKARGLVQQKTGKTPALSVRVLPDLVQREVAVGISLVAAVLLFSALVNAPLSDAANPGVSPNPAKAAWFFLGLQELLMHFHPIYAICIVPGIIALGVLFLPYWPESSLPEGVWFGGKRGGYLAGVISIISAALTVGAVLVDDFAVNSFSVAAADMYTRGLLPLVGLLILSILGYHILTKVFGYTRAEAVMAGFISMVIALVCLTIIGIWFRGPGMQLVLPF